jgi:hypothetical protein
MATRGKKQEPLPAFAFRFTPVVERSFTYNIFNNNTEPSGEYIRSFDHWTGTTK